MNRQALEKHNFQLSLSHFLLYLLMSVYACMRVCACVFLHVCVSCSDTLGKQNGDCFAVSYENLPYCTVVFIKLMENIFPRLHIAKATIILY